MYPLKNTNMCRMFNSLKYSLHQIERHMYIITLDDVYYITLYFKLFYVNTKYFKIF